MRLTLSILACFIISACASSPDDLQTQYVSELQYQGQDCDQLAFEESRITRRVSELYGSLDKKAGDDAAQMGIGLVLFWPTLFFLEGGDGPQAQEFARLKGEHEAIERVANQKKCVLNITPVSQQVQAMKEAREAKAAARRKAERGN
ncbi:MAG: metal ABC transporter ATP-binding protein [Rhodospirillales bacterium]|nr:metal ABC transporter ATP-binding protein [Rhodospirillales bacterium]